jgi:hypothetical protein
MTVGQIILLAMVPFGALLMLAFSHVQMKLMPPSREPADRSTTERRRPATDYPV